MPPQEPSQPEFSNISVGPAKKIKFCYKGTSSSYFLEFPTVVHFNHWKIRNCGFHVCSRLALEKLNLNT